jgi:hypothetical protein
MHHLSLPQTQLCSAATGVCGGGGASPLHATPARAHHGGYVCTPLSRGCFSTAAVHQPLLEIGTVTGISTGVYAALPGGARGLVFGFFARTRFFGFDPTDPASGAALPCAVEGRAPFVRDSGVALGALPAAA